MKIGIIKERKTPIDRRVPFSPEQCIALTKQYSDLTILVEPSDIRCFKDEEYAKKGIKITEDLTDCDILMGVKEVPLNHLIPHKTYFFFSHTIKKQSYNKTLLQEILSKKIQLIDYETLRQDDNRIVAFGRYAGIVGAYNALLTYGLKHKLYNLKPANACSDFEEMKSELKKIKKLNTNILITGTGRVSQGAKEVLELCPLSQTTPSYYIKSKDKSLFTMIDVSEYVSTTNGEPFSKVDFFKNPTAHKTIFSRFIPNTSILIAGAYWDQNAPKLFEKGDVKNPDFNIEVIADITCDIEGSIPTTIRSSTIDQPIYDINPLTIAEEPFQPGNKNISVMAVDNLPCELPKDASISFGAQLTKNVIPQLLRQDDGRIKNAAITTPDGQITDKYSYLKDWVNS